MADDIRGESPPNDTENVRTVDYVNLPPDYEQTAKWFGSALLQGAFESHEATMKAMGSFIEQIRYLAQTDLPAVQRVIHYFSRPQPVVEGVTVITAEGTTTGNLMSDDSIEVDEHLEADYENRYHEDDPSLQDTTPQELLDLDKEAGL